MFLMSEAFRRRAATNRPFDWPAATILFVSHQWNPLRDGAEALAGRRLVRCLLDAGARIHVLAADRGDDEPDHPHYQVTVVSSGTMSTNRFGRGLQMMRSTIPEVAGQWVPGAVAAGVDILRSLPADVHIYSRAAPGSSNIVGWKLARLTGRPFVAHFSDAWPSFHMRMKRSRFMAPYKLPLFNLWRRRILRDAAALTFTNPAEARQVLAGAAARYESKVFVAAHLPCRRSGVAPPPQQEVFHLVHTGNLYPPGHTARTLMLGIQLFLTRRPEARRVFRLTQAGWSNGDLPESMARCGLEDVVRLVGRLNQSDVIALLDTATLLLAIDYARPYSTTVLSKLPDYLSAQRPILAITSPSSAMSRLFRDDGAGQTAHYDSPAEIATCIAAVYDAWTERRLDALLPQPAARESFTPSRVLSELGAAFETARTVPSCPTASVQ